MSNKRIPVRLTRRDLAQIEQAIATLEEAFADLPEYTDEERRQWTPLTPEGEAFCRQVIPLLARNPQILPPDFDIAKAEQDLRTLDLLRPRIEKIRRLVELFEDLQIAVGNDTLDAGLNEVKEIMSDRQPGKPAQPPAE